MSRRSRATPWWENCGLLGHDCRWCKRAMTRAIHLEVEQQVVDLDARLILDLAKPGQPFDIYVVPRQSVFPRPIPPKEFLK